MRKRSERDAQPLDRSELREDEVLRGEDALGPVVPSRIRSELRRAGVARPEGGELLDVVLDAFRIDSLDELLDLTVEFRPGVALAFIVAVVAPGAARHRDDEAHGKQ